MPYYLDINETPIYCEESILPYINHKEVSEDIQEALKTGLTLSELSDLLISKMRRKERISKISKASSMYTRWFSKGWIHWGEGNRIYLSEYPDRDKIIRIDCFDIR